MNKTMILRMIDAGKTNLLDTFNATPDDKISWKPLDNGRTALDLMGEAAQTALFSAKVAQSRGEFKINREMFGQLRADRANWTRQEAVQQLETNHAALLEAIEGLSDEDLGQMVTMNIGHEMTLPLAGWAMMSYRTYISRFAQINYIQTLYGDFDAH